MIVEIAIAYKSFCSTWKFDSAKFNFLFSTSGQFENVWSTIYVQDVKYRLPNHTRHSGPASKIFVRKLFLVQKVWKNSFQWKS